METSKKRKNAKHEITFALFVLLKKKPYEEVTVKEISERAGVTRMSFYRHFNNKEDVFAAFADDRFVEFGNILSRMKERDVPTLLRTFFEFIERCKESIQILIDVGQYGIMLEKFESYFSWLWKKYIRHSAPTRSIDKYAVSFISGGFYNSTLQWFKHDLKDDASVIANELYELLVGLAK